MLTTVRVVLLTGAMLAAIGGLTSAAEASPVDCAKRDAQTGICLVAASSPGQDDGAAPVVADAGSGGDAAPENPCTFTLAEPQPTVTSPLWAGQSPDDGAMYVKVCPRVDGSGLTTMLVYLANGAAPPAAPVSPQVLAEQAIASLVMRAPEIRMAPPPGSASGLVGLPVWMWTERGEEFLGPTSQSASAGGVTVTAVGQVGRVSWDMGDGTTVVCGAGTPYSPGGAEGESPDCGHVYAQASSRHVAGGGAWPITATSTWTITWSGGGLSGTETLELSSSAELFVGELHVLNQDGSSR